MGNPFTSRARVLAALAALSLASAACNPTTVGPGPGDGAAPLVDNGAPPGDGGACVGGAPTLRSGVRIPVSNAAVEDVDILFEVDNSNSMAENQANLARNFGLLIDQLVNPPVDPMTMRPRYPPVRSLHVGVISSDLGTPGSVVPSCANSDQGDDGLLNPIRNGLALRQHAPWTTAPPGRRPSRCTMDPNQFPSFLTFSTMTSDATQFREEFICNAYLSTGGCSLEQQLESMYRALVVHNPREQAGNTDPNAGFVRDNALLALVMVTDEEDGSVRDCRYAERGVPCTDAVSVFDIRSPEWSSGDLNLRFYMYTPGSVQDPTWPLDRYIDPTRPTRGFTSLKPGRPEMVLFSAITGVPINLPTRMNGSTTEVDYDTLLGRMPDGSDAFTGMSAEGPVSMRQRNMDPACPTRVVPACRREGSTQPASCDAVAQYFAWPSRRIAQVARRFQERYQNGALSSICKNDYAGTFQQIVERVQSRLSGRCLPRPIDTAAAPCEPGDTRGNCVRTNCIVREILPAGTSAAAVCVAARGRVPGARDTATGRETCVVGQVALPPGMAPPAGREGFYYDTRPDPLAPDCRQHVEFTSGAGLVPGATAVIECVASEAGPAPAAPACSGAVAVGGACTPSRPGGGACTPASGVTDGCFRGTEIYVESGSRACRSGLCMSYRYDEASDPTGRQRGQRLVCTCRCGVPESLRATVPAGSLCTCPTGMTCQADLFGPQYLPELQGSYCVSAAAF